MTRIASIATAIATPLTATLLLSSLASPVLAHGDHRCDPHPKAQWRDHNELFRELKDKGWDVRKMVVSNNCYEVYAKTPEGKRVEAFFDPKSFERIDDKK